MPKGNQRKRNTSRANISRVIRKIRTRPLAHVRPRATIRSKGNSSATINVLRNIKGACRKISKDGKVDGKWWFETIKTVGYTIFKILSTALIATELEEHLKLFPLPLAHPLKGKLLAGSCVTGSITRLCLGPEDLLVDSDFIKIEDPGATWMSAVYGTARYRQAKVEWVKVVIQPTNSLTVREGTIIACLRPITEMEAIQDFEDIGNEDVSWEELQRAPGAICKSAGSPTVLTWSPTISDRAYQWLTIGTQAKDKSRYAVGGDIFLYLDIGYQNWTSADNKPNNEYGLDKTMFDITIESRIHLKSFDDQVHTRAMPFTTVVPNDIGVSEYGKHAYSVPCSETYLHHGVFIYEKPSEMEMI